ncbi:MULTISPECIES: MarR family winged helix-turn-helix transcriptional regulator [Actinopolyspora]|uniref:DNA-binding transcriptional regulator, MarR family n=1 Tax=Actinopolyspora saharensis TaxID=995062 RepID=A0A1H0ZRE2_9ACTN|nr:MULTISPECIES: MarR family transcriptional regulator [Actinopolyspora]NHD15624.1 MarR family transcriptional regulator [Actinopolyspora sp. BKK2]NHE75163.1 MarR family transcriptional regulator [Actinopolyspora sp. BKK1]SDQ29967.1 DNA-binding transcriptional regulator, MarR family [Actinopolyspora saharensis]
MDIATSLSRLLGPLRRAVLRSTRAAEDLPDLPEAQIELLRALAAEGPMGTKAAAERLRTSPATVSNLVRTMSAAGLIDRQTSPNDLRTVNLSVTTTAQQLLHRYDAASRTTLEQAMSGLSDEDRDALARAVPALERLTAELDSRSAHKPGTTGAAE